MFQPSKHLFNMKKYIYLAMSVSLLAFTSCKNDTKKVDEIIEIEEVDEVVETPEKYSKTVSFALESKSGSDAKGEVTFVQKGDQVMFQASLTGLEPGSHAIHIHEKADCSSDDGKSSGGHWNPTFKDHGKWGDEAGYHKGDIGNFNVGEDGKGNISMSTDEWCIGCDDETKNILGKAIIVHQGKDDFTSQPSGAAGARVSCGGIIQ